MPTSTSTVSHLRLAFFWACLGALGALAIAPYAFSLAPSDKALPAPLPILAIAAALQTGLLLLLLNWIGLRLGYPLSLDSPIARAWVFRQPLPPLVRSALMQALAIGSLGGLLLLGLDLAFQPWLPPTIAPTQPPIDLWKRLLAAFYGGITEELLLRLFCMTVIVWLLWKLLERHKPQPGAWIYGSAITIAAVLFGLGHLPAAAAIWTLTPVVILRILTLNALLGLPFGWLYWKWGLEYAMLAHFCADIVVQSIGRYLS